MIKYLMYNCPTPRGENAPFPPTHSAQELGRWGIPFRCIKLGWSISFSAQFSVQVSCHVTETDQEISFTKGPSDFDQKCYTYLAWNHYQTVNAVSSSRVVVTLKKVFLVLGTV